MFSKGAIQFELFLQTPQQLKPLPQPLTDAQA